MSDVINHKTTKFESNSQRCFPTALIPKSCYQSQNYKIWNQFTTLYLHHAKKCQMLSIAKLQNLKAIHNKVNAKQAFRIVVINHKTTKFESNSQRLLRTVQKRYSCYQSQNYKIWKQFTTSKSLKYLSAEMLSITKLQNLKAIHNGCPARTCRLSDVINHKTTKFESNSQLLSR